MTLNEYTLEFWDKVETPLGLTMSQVLEMKTNMDVDRLCRARTRALWGPWRNHPIGHN